MTHESRTGPRPVRIHARGEAARLDRVLELAAFAAKPCPLSTSLDELPVRIAAILQADVCSIYLLEGDELVMRGNVGFRSDALGEVRLAVGEGITGTSVECMRPVSTAHAKSHGSYRHFDSLDEERFPIFLAVPVSGPSGPLGALVLQRAEKPAFSQSEIELSAALTAPIAAAAERAHLREALRGERRTTAGGETRRVNLPGRAVVHGRAVGAAYAMRRPASRPAPEAAQSKREVSKRLTSVLSRAQTALDALDDRARQSGLDRTQLALIRTLLDDGRMRERTLELCEEGKPLAAALQAVGAEAAREAARSREPTLVARAQELSDVCEALAMLSGSDRRVVIPAGAVLIGDRITVFDLIVTAQHSVSAVALSEPARSDGARTLLQLLGVPAVSDVHGLFRWVSDGEILLVDGDHGLVRVNPSRADIATLRATQRTP
ncbi:MAG: GAF domain-containing protein [Deltaproteobacteria bacterium]|nr:GAF domain-containing protein [Deltaproteobacteria bacterium]